MKSMASRAVCWTVLAVVPVEPPTPALSTRMTSRLAGDGVDELGVPAVESAAEVLQEDQGDTAGAGVAEAAVLVGDAACAFDTQVGGGARALRVLGPGDRVPC